MTRLDFEPNGAGSDKLGALEKLMAALRTPGTGCPWDLEQTFATIAPYTIEEAYEVADAIAREDWPGLRDELGDLLFQVVFHAHMAHERHLFNLADVIDSLVDKMTRRHPHVFGMNDGRSAAEQTRAWEDIKAAERAKGPQRAEGVLGGVARALPAAKRAQKLQSRAARTGFDWPDASGPKTKIAEELIEIEDALAANEPAKVTEEAGDLLFAVVNYVRHLGVDAETALAAANDKFERRFHAMEVVASQAGTPLDGLALDQLEELWSYAKKHL